MFDLDRETDAPKVRLSLDDGLSRRLFDTAQSLSDAADRAGELDPDEKVMLETIGARIIGHEGNGNADIHFPLTDWGDGVLWSAATDAVEAVDGPLSESGKRTESIEQAIERVHVAETTLTALLTFRQARAQIGKAHDARGSRS